MALSPFWDSLKLIVGCSATRTPFCTTALVSGALVSPAAVPYQLALPVTLVPLAPVTINSNLPPPKPGSSQLPVQLPANLLASTGSLAAAAAAAAGETG